MPAIGGHCRMVLFYNRRFSVSSKCRFTAVCVNIFAGMAGFKFLGALNVKKRCDVAGVGLWQCPHFLFIIMGTVIIAAILATDIVARRYTEPEIAALIVLLVSALLFIMGHIIVRSFENVVEASRLKSEFVSIVSHELRSPLSAVKWSLDLLKSEPAYAEKANDSYSIISMIGEQNEKMIRLVNTLLEVRRVEDKKIDLAPEKISLREITEKTLQDMDSFARASNVTPDLNFGSDGIVFADPKKIGFVVASLTENALRYSPGGTSVGIEIFRKSGKVFWRISDHGPGIPEEDRKMIFSRFFRSNNVFRYRSGGLGVGLFISKAYIKASGGEMGFSSKKKKGSIFWFSLPELKTKG